MHKKHTKINRAIIAKTVRLIDSTGNMQGIISLEKALEAANIAGLDLVEIAPRAKPPVCRIIDYSKYKFNREKQIKKSRKKFKQKKDKEIRMKPLISDHDLEIKASYVNRFLAKGMKVKIYIRFKGRELAHTNRGKFIYNKLLKLLETNYIVEEKPKMQGRSMIMFLRPETRS